MLINRFFLMFFILLSLFGCQSKKSSTDENSSTPKLNTAPVAIAQELKIQEESSVKIDLKGRDEEANLLRFMLLSQPAHGALSGLAPYLTYTPSKDFAGEDSFTFKVNDGEFDSKEVEIKIEIEAVNDQPIAESLRLMLAQDSNKTFTLSAYDVDSRDLNYMIEIFPTHGSLSGVAPELIYTPFENYVGEDYFAFKVNDGELDSAVKDVNLTVIPSTEVRVSISGKLTYDLVPSASTHDSLDYANIRRESVKGVVVELLDADNGLLQSTHSDLNGSYLFTDIESKKEVKIRVYAKMQKSGTPSWNVMLVDNTQNGALYGFEGKLLSSGTEDSIRNLHALSGWDGSSYASIRTAAPFAILNVVYKSMQNILEVDANATFPPLRVNWSTHNVASGGALGDGQIGTSHYQDSNLYILGDANGDTDEYDDHVIAHEWGHYYEDKFSRTDSLGGSHGDGDHLDIRVAFGEGFGNAISAISLRDPIYFDIAGLAQASGWSMDVEQGAGNNRGWFSEVSVQHILYDLYDDHDDGDDNLSLGFAPMHHIFVGKQKHTPSFTSLFSFIHALKSEHNQSAFNIDQIVAKEGIAEIKDNDGRDRSILSAESPYVTLTVGTTLSLCTTNTYGHLGSRNKLSNHKYVRFFLDSNGKYHLKIERNNGTGSDPDFYIYKTTPDFSLVDVVESPRADVEEVNASIPSGNYLLDISDWNTKENACFDVSVEGV